MTSDSENLDIVVRLKLVFDNRNDIREGLKPSPCISRCGVPTISGTEHALSRVLIHVTRKNDLSSDLLKRLAPESVDTASLASQIGRRFILDTKEQEKIRRQLPALLADFGVAKLDEQVIRQRIANNFVKLWPTLKDDQWLELIECVQAHELIAELKNAATTLPTVRVRDNQRNATKWTSPDGVISPYWTTTNPPGVSPGTCPALEAIGDSVCEVWNSWCGINRFESVVVQCS